MEKITTQNTVIRYFSFWERREPLTLSNHLHWPSTLIPADVSLKPCCFISVLCQENFVCCTPGDRCEIMVPSQRRIADILYSRALAHDMADWVSYKPAQTTGVASSAHLPLGRCVTRNLKDTKPLYQCVLWVFSLDKKNNNPTFSFSWSF